MNRRRHPADVVNNKPRRRLTPLRETSNAAMRNAKGLAASAACHDLGQRARPDQRTREGESVMKQNMGTVDRAPRAFVVAPAAVVVAFLVGTGTVGGIILPEPDNTLRLCSAGLGSEGSRAPAEPAPGLRAGAEGARPRPRIG